MSQMIGRYMLAFACFSNIAFKVKAGSFWIRNVFLNMKRSPNVYTRSMIKYWLLNCMSFEITTLTSQKIVGCNNFIAHSPCFYTQTYNNIMHEDAPATKITGCDIHQSRFAYLFFIFIIKLSFSHTCGGYFKVITVQTRTPLAINIQNN